VLAIENGKLKLVRPAGLFHLQRSSASLWPTNNIMEKEEIVRLSRAIQDIIVKSGEKRLRPKELMPDLIAQGFFKKDEKFGKPLRDVMNRLDKGGLLDLIPQVIPDRQEKAVYWYFEAADMPEPKPEKKKPVAKKVAAKSKPAPKAATLKKTATAAKPKAAPKAASPIVAVKKVAAKSKPEKTVAPKATAVKKTTPSAKPKAAPKAASTKVAVKKPAVAKAAPAKKETAVKKAVKGKLNPEASGEN
jgi:hypothetical protein